jgi:hypothetical protein
MAASTKPSGNLAMLPRRSLRDRKALVGPLIRQLGIRAE